MSSIYKYLQGEETKELSVFSGRRIQLQKLSSLLIMIWFLEPRPRLPFGHSLTLIPSSASNSAGSPPLEKKVLSNPPKRIGSK